MKSRKWLMGVVFAAVLSAASMPFALSQASAQVTESAALSDNVIRLTPDRTQVLRLDRDAASVVVTNPATVRVLLDTPRLLLLMPRTPGSTSFMVMGANGETLLEKTVIVDALAKPKYVRIRRMCGQAGTGADCVPTSYFYCPDGCYEVSPVNPANDTGEVPTQNGGASTGGSSAFAGAQPGDLAPAPGNDAPTATPAPPPSPAIPVPQ